MSSEVSAWWTLLRVVAVLNIAAWAVAAIVFAHRRATSPPSGLSSARAQLILSAVYVLGCAYRSFFPVFDVPRLCLFDSPLSSIFIGRTVATMAELAFVAQWAVMLRDTARETGSRVPAIVAIFILPMMCVAEACSWYSVLTTSNLGHVFEEALWAAFGMVLLVTGAAVWVRCSARWRLALIAWGVVGAAYVGFMTLVDVPMYYSRWVADEARGRQYFGLLSGVMDAALRRSVSFDWHIWRGEVPWMTVYFSLAVWLSILMVNAAGPRRRESVSVVPAVASRAS